LRKILAVLLLTLLFAQAHASPALHGSWSSPQVQGRPLLVEFAADGSGRINGQPMRWQALGPMLFVEQNGQVATYGFSVEGDKLNVSGGDLAQPAVLGKGRAAYDAAIKQAKAAPGQAGKGASPAKAGAQPSNGDELVGKWCDMHTMTSQSGGGSSRMACFELRPDRTYVYSAESSRSVAAGSTASQSGDAGRWSYDGSQLVAQSRSGRTNTYTLEKRNHPKNKRDPMICLDGKCYVTFYNKQAW